VFETFNSGAHPRVLRSAVAIAVAAVVYFVAPSARATTLPAGFTETNYVTGLSAPNSFEFTPDGRIFICQQTGQIRVVDASGVLLTQPFLTLTVDSNGERGLLGLALDPSFATNNFLYVYYTATTPAVHNRVSRFTANGNVVQAGSEVILLDLNNLSGATNHNGGCLRFGADGKLYISVGENANGTNAQTLTNLLGKILRINSNGTIPSDNPFFNDNTGIRKEIWAYGFRNPWRFTIQPGTGDLVIADVGNNTWEEVDIGQAGMDFGWPGVEGNGHGTCPTASCVNPIFEYNHNGTSAAITGGDFYQGVAYPSSFNGVYFYGDSSKSFIRYLVLDQNNAVVSDNDFATSASGPVEIRYHDQAMWYTAINSGQLRRITFPSRAPLAGDWDFNAATSIGLYTPTTGLFALRNSNSPGAADFFFQFGGISPNRVAVSGDWDGSGTDTVGLYDRSTGTFFLRNANSPGGADLTFAFGAAGNGFTPIAGDWNGDGTDTIGLFDPATGNFFLKNSNTSGGADIVFQFGAGGNAFLPVVGDWNNDGVDTIGLYSRTTGTFFLRNSNSSGGADLAFTFGAGGSTIYPLGGNWDGAGGDSVGLYNVATGVYFLKNTNSAGGADLTFNFGATGQ